MINEEQFSVSLECEVYLVQEAESVGESSSIIPGKFIGWTSITSDDFNLSDDNVYELLQVSHIKEEFARKLLNICLSTIQMKKFNQKNSKNKLTVKDIWISGYISRKYLYSIGDDELLDKVENYNDEIRIVDN